MEKYFVDQPLLMIKQPHWKWIGLGFAFWATNAVCTTKTAFSGFTTFWLHLIEKLKRSS